MRLVLKKLKKKLEGEKKTVNLVSLIFLTTQILRNMSGLIQWTSKAKRKPGKKSAGSKPNARRQRLLASRRRKARESAAKASKKTASEKLAE